jgi:hypothetical protein
VNSAIDLTNIKGQEHSKRALEVAAAGGHNMLLLWTQSLFPIEVRASGGWSASWCSAAVMAPLLLVV